MRDSSGERGSALWLAAGALFVIAACINGFSDGLLDVLPYTYALIGTAAFAAAGILVVLAAPGEQIGIFLRNNRMVMYLGLPPIVCSILVLLEANMVSPPMEETPGYLMLFALPELIVVAAICLASASPPDVSAAATDSAATDSPLSVDTEQRSPASTWIMCAVLYAAVLAVSVGGTFLEEMLANNVAFPASRILVLLLLTGALTCALRADALISLAQQQKLFVPLMVLSMPTLMAIFSLAITNYGGHGELYDFTYLDVILEFIGALGLLASIVLVSLGAWRSRKA